MSETPDISEEQTVPAMAAVPPDSSLPGTPTDISQAQTAAMAPVPSSSGSSGAPPMDFGPLIDDEDDFDLTPMPPMAPPRRRLRWPAWVALGLLIILIGAGILIFLRSSHAAPVQYTQAAATTGNLTVTVAGSGPITPNAIYNLNFSTSSAPITAIYVKIGQKVTKGQKLAALDSTTLQDSVTQAQNTVNSTSISLGQAQASLNTAKTQQATALNLAQLNEQKALADCAPPVSVPSLPSPTPGPGTPGLTNAQAQATQVAKQATATEAQVTATAESTCKQLARQQYTQAQQQASAPVTAASNQVASAQQQVNNAVTGLQTAQDNLKNDILYAPHDGEIEAVNGLVGETTGSGNSASSSSSSSSSSALIVLTDDSILSIQSAVSESDIATIQINQPATFTVAAYPTQTFRAIVSSVDKLGTSSSSVVTYTVDLAVDMQSLNGANIYAGMTATTNITTAERISTLLVPSASLTFSTTALQSGEITRSQLSSLVGGSGSTGSTGSRGIVVELKAGKLVPVLVTTGLTNGQDTEILSGLQEGDQVVVAQTGGTTSTTPVSGAGGGGGGRGGFGGGFGGGGGVAVP